MGFAGVGMERVNCHHSAVQALKGLSKGSEAGSKIFGSPNTGPDAKRPQTTAAKTSLRFNMLAMLHLQWRVSI